MPIPRCRVPPRAWRALFLAGVFAASVWPAAADEVAAARDAMIEAMARMMRVMGFTATEPLAGQPAPGTLPDTGAELSARLGVLPELAPFVDPVRAFSLPRVPPPRTTRLPAGLDWRATTLEGIWEDRDGGLLIVIGPRFRIYKPNAGHVDGLIQQRGERVVLYNPANGQARPYEYAELQGRLALRDPEGNLFLYRRLWLEQNADQATNR